MSIKYQAYPESKDSGIEWLDDIPRHWDVIKLKFMAKVQPSNVDKKTKDGEVPVALCNYTDVYYNDVVDLSLDLMKASATEEQVKKFTLRGGDTIITKDSEDPNDIAIPTFVQKNMDGVVCGYHLALIRPKNIVYGLYIKRAFECGYARAYFATRSNGLTRYGLGAFALDNIFYPKPPEEEAEKIANFLDHKTAKIDTLIEKQQQLIKLLKEKRQAVISHAVTKGLNPNAPMRDSGVEWLGEVPEHWVSCSLKHYSRIIDCKHITADFFDEGIPLASISEVKEWYVNLATAKLTNEKFYLDLIEGERKPQLGDIIFSRNATVGEASLVADDMPDFAMGQDVCLIRLDEGILSEYILYVLKSGVISNQLDLAMVGSTFKRINVDDIRNFFVALPSYEEQIEIVTELSCVLDKYDTLVNYAESTIELMSERRTALISAAVTGKIDVRNWKAA